MMTAFFVPSGVCSVSLGIFYGVEPEVARAPWYAIVLLGLACLCAPAWCYHPIWRVAFQRILFTYITTVAGMVYLAVAANTLESISVYTFLIVVVTSTLMLGSGWGAAVAVVSGSVYWYLYTQMPPVEGPIEIYLLKAGSLSVTMWLIYGGAAVFRAEMMRASSSLRQERRRAMAASEAKSAFLANMSHEIRTPMNGIIGLAEALSNEPLTPDQQRYADTIRSSGEILVTLINDILDFSKIEAGQLTIEKKPVDLTRLAGDITELLSRTAHEKGLALNKELPYDLPVVMGDPTRLRQILINLVGNAVKFTEEGGVTLQTRFDETPDGVTVVFEVRDTGIGIPEDKQEEIFSPFAQAEESTTRRFGGTGLGLTITRRLVTMMGGDLTLRSVVGEGSIFTVSLPMAHAEMTPEASAASEESTTDAAPIESAWRLLVAEDNQVNRMVLETLLRETPWSIVFAGNGEEAVALAKAEDFDLILMDISMPVLDGLGATEQIRAWEADEGRTPTPIIALTAHAIAGDKERFLAAGMNDYLTKPIRGDELIAGVKRWAGQAGADEGGKTQAEAVG